MPIEQIESGEGFCMALTQDGIVLCWGDGEEGKLGLGDLRRQARPTVLEFLLSEEHRAQLMSSKQRDRLLPAGSRIARPLESKFMVMSISCGARHSLALSSAGEVLSWGSGACGQLGHGGIAGKSHTPC